MKMPRSWTRLSRRPNQRHKRVLEELEEQRKAVRLLQDDLEKQRALNLQRRTTIRTLRSKLDTTRAELARAEDVRNASYRVALRQHVRIIRAQRAANHPGKHPTLQLRYKLHIYELAASHGIPVPKIYGVWPNTATIDLDKMPDEFVLKADGGSNGRSVFPIQRIDHDHYQTLGAKSIYTAEELRRALDDLGRQALPPFFCEELLRSIDGEPVPNDVKFYMFHGTIGQVLLRKATTPTRGTALPARFIDSSGTDFGAVPIGRPYDPTIPAPAELDSLSTVARHISRTVGIPFCRVDLYETSRGVVLGEITAAPSSGREKFKAEHDERLGRLWIDATVRLDEEIADGRPSGIIFGSLATPRLYPDPPISTSPNNFAHSREPCRKWC